MKEQIREALDNATPGPWGWSVMEDSRHVIWDHTFFNRHIAEIVRGGVENEQREEDNAILIANSPTWLRWQNERIEQLEKALEHISNTYERELLDYPDTLEECVNVARQALGKEE